MRRRVVVSASASASPLSKTRTTLPPLAESGGSRRRSRRRSSPSRSPHLKLRSHRTAPTIGTTALMTREHAADGWVKFVNDAKFCIKHYNNENQADYKYKHSIDNGFELVEEEDGNCYYHLNFLAQDHNGHSQLFFGEIKLHAPPKDDIVSCCCPVSTTDACGKSIRTLEEAWKHGFPEWEIRTAELDLKNCYSCHSLMRHPKEAPYIAGKAHQVKQDIADSESSATELKRLVEFVRQG